MGQWTTRFNLLCLLTDFSGTSFSQWLMMGWLSKVVQSPFMSKGIEHSAYHKQDVCAPILHEMECVCVQPSLWIPVQIHGWYLCACSMTTTSFPTPQTIHPSLHLPPSPMSLFVFLYPCLVFPHRKTLVIRILDHEEYDRRASFYIELQEPTWNKRLTGVRVSSRIVRWAVSSLLTSSSFSPSSSYMLSSSLSPISHSALCLFLLSQALPFSLLHCIASGQLCLQEAVGRIISDQFQKVDTWPLQDPSWKALRDIKKQKFSLLRIL